MASPLVAVFVMLALTLLTPRVVVVMMVLMMVLVARAMMVVMVVVVMTMMTRRCRSTLVAFRLIASVVVRPARVVLVLGGVFAAVRGGRVVTVPPGGGAFGFATRARRRLGGFDVPESRDGGLHLRLGSAGLGRRRNNQGSVDADGGVGVGDGGDARVGASRDGADRLGRARDAGEVGAGAGLVGPRGVSRSGVK